MIQAGDDMLYYMFNKPQGCVTARSDAVHRTVMDYFPSELAEKLHPVGRLDKDTCGLLILTDDGDLDFKIMQPDRHISKTYFFYAIGTMNEEKRQLLESGIAMAGFTAKEAVFQLHREYRIGELEGFMPAERRERYMKNTDGAAFSASITICEGKKHQVKRMLEAVGCRIFYLRRDKIGELPLDSFLGQGEYRQLTENEVILLKQRL
ncbi:pseudouridine synthase [Ruminococcus flavefaciens]|uniref:pseudouridine synthase n=1 Tax=Ruminococcus flavefaciens TaxID=1265 RepID=UPI003F0A9CEE